MKIHWLSVPLFAIHVGLSQDVVTDQYYLMDDMRNNGVLETETNNKSCNVTNGSQRGKFTGTGTRKLIKFGIPIANISGDWDVRPLYTNDPCDGGEWLRDFAKMTVYNGSGTNLQSNYKDYYCLTNTDQYLPNPGENPVGCNYLPYGWADVYSYGTDGAWVDVTNLSNGEYTVEVTANPLSLTPEAPTANNTAWITFNLDKTTNSYGVIADKTLGSNQNISNKKVMFGVQNTATVTGGTHTLTNNGRFLLQGEKVSLTGGSVVVTSGVFSALAHVHRIGTF